MSEEQTEFEEKVEENMYWTLRGCEEEGTVEIPKTLFNFIYNIAGTCTDDSETADYYNNPRAMFTALDLIYLGLNEIVRNDTLTVPVSCNKTDTKEKTQ